MRKRHDEKMRAMHDAGNDRIRLAKVRLGMTRRVRQRHEHLPQTKVPFANVILHDRLLAREAMFVTKTLEDPLRRVPLLAVNRAILFQNAVDDIRERRQLRALRRLASPISRRFRMQQYLGNRLAVDPELARSFPSAQTLTMTRQSHSSIKIHSVHPPPSIRSILTKAIDGPILVRRRNRTNRPLHWGIIAPPFSSAPSSYEIEYGYSRSGRITKVKSPTETTTYKYDGDGLLTAEVFGNQTRRLHREESYPWVNRQAVHGVGGVRETTWHHNDAGDIVEQTTSDSLNTESQRFENYNAFGRPELTRAFYNGTEELSTRWTYALNGKLESRERFLSGTSLGKNTWSYYRNGVVSQVQTPSGLQVKFDYDTRFDHRLRRVYDGSTGTDFMVFNARNARGQPLFAETASSRVQFKYDDRGRLEERNNFDIGATTPRTTWTVERNDLGEIVQEAYAADDASWENSFSYDVQGRLTCEYQGKVDTTFTYQLDLSGNRQATRVFDGQHDCQNTLDAPAAVTDFEYQDDQLLRVNGTDLEYDPWGGVVADHRGTKFQRSPIGRVRSIQSTDENSDTQTIVRDAYGLPTGVRRDGGPAEIRFWGLDARQLPLEIHQPDGSRIGFVRADGMVARLTMPVGSGGILSEERYSDISGSVHRQDGRSIAPTTAFGQNLSPLASNDVLFAFHGMEKVQGQNDTHLARYRVYDAELGRFLSPDPSGLSAGAHRLLYAHGNPVRYADPMGLDAVVIDGVVQDLPPSTIAMMVSSGATRNAWEVPEGILQGNFLVNFLPPVGCPPGAICHPSDPPDGGGERNTEEEGDTSDDGGTDGDPCGSVLTAVPCDEDGGDVTDFDPEPVPEEPAPDQAGDPLPPPGLPDGGSGTPDPGSTADSGGLGSGGGGGNGPWWRDYVDVRTEIIGDVLSERWQGFSQGVSGMLNAAAHPIDSFMNYTPVGLAIGGNYGAAARLYGQGLALPFVMAAQMAKTVGRAAISPFEQPYRGGQFFLGSDPNTIRAGVNGYIDSTAAQVEVASMMTGAGPLEHLGTKLLNSRRLKAAAQAAQKAELDVSNPARLDWENARTTNQWDTAKTKPTDRGFIQEEEYASFHGDWLPHDDAGNHIKNFDGIDMVDEWGVAKQHFSTNAKDISGEVISKINATAKKAKGVEVDGIKAPIEVDVSFKPGTIDDMIGTPEWDAMFQAAKDNGVRLFVYEH